MKKILLSILSALIFWLAWRNNFLCLSVFVAFVPLFFLFKEIDKMPKKNKGKFYFLYSLLTFFLWNFSTTYWVWNSTPVAVGAWIANAMLMSLAVYFYYLCNKNINKTKINVKFKTFLSFACFITFWLAFEFLHYHWDLNWPWLALGNALAPLHQTIQFYEFTGVTGGSLWILVCNFLILSILNKILKKESVKKNLLAFAIVFLLPISYSLIRYFTYVEKGKDVEIVVIQPNTDPYNQYDIDSDVLMDKVFALINQKITSNTALIVAPESMILDYAWEENIQFYPSIMKIQEYLQDFPQTEFLSGISTMQIVDKESYASRYIKSLNRHYVIHNTALLLSKDRCNEMYFKSRLTPGVEIVPFSNIFPFIKNFAVDLGGAVGSLAVDNSAKVFKSEYSHPSFSANICYESVFPDYVRQFVKNGAEYICIITNDGWWGDTEGYHQHQRYAKLRAIETRRDIARSANTGISCFVNQRGDVFQTTNYWEEAVISQNIKAHKGKSFFVLTGDYIGIFSSAVAILSIFVLMIFAILKKKRNFEN